MSEEQEVPIEVPPVAAPDAEQPPNSSMVVPDVPPVADGPETEPQPQEGALTRQAAELAARQAAAELRR